MPHPPFASEALRSPGANGPAIEPRARLCALSPLGLGFLVRFGRTRMRSARPQTVLGGVVLQDQPRLGPGSCATYGQAVEPDGHKGDGNKVFHLMCSIDSGYLGASVRSACVGRKDAQPLRRKSRRAAASVCTEIRSEEEAGQAVVRTGTSSRRQHRRTAEARAEPRAVLQSKLQAH